MSSQKSMYHPQSNYQLQLLPQCLDHNYNHSNNIEKLAVLVIIVIVIPIVSVIVIVPVIVENQK